MATIEAVEPQQAIYPMTIKTTVKLAVVGAITGIIIWLIALILGQYVIEPIFCRSAINGAVCSSAPEVAGNIATVLAALVGMFALVKVAVFRPMLIAVSSAVVLWGIMGWLDHFPWYGQMIWSALLYALVYLLFGWIARINNFFTALVIAIAIVAIARIVPAL